MKKAERRKRKVMVVVVVISLLLMVHTFYRFDAKYFAMASEEKQQELKNASQSVISDMQKRYASMISNLKFLAESLSDLSSVEDETVVSQIKLLSQVSNFDYIGIADLEGNSIDSSGNRTQIKDRTYFQQAIKGTSTVSDILMSKVINNKEIQIIAVPIKKGEKVRGITFGVLGTDTITDMLDNESDGKIYTQIVDSKGNYLVEGTSKEALVDHKNAWDDLKQYTFLQGSIEQLKEDMAEHRSGHFTFRMGKEERVSYYASLGLEDYYIFTTINRKYIKEQMEEINVQVLYMSAEIALAFVLFILGLSWYHKRIQEELKESHDLAVSREEMLKIAIGQSDQSVFEYDIATGELSNKAGIKSRLFPEEKTREVPESVIASGIIEKDSIPVFREIFQEIRNADVCEAEIQIREKDKKQWYRIGMKNIYDAHGAVVNTIGIVEDISEKKEQEEQLKEKQRIQDALNADAFMAWKTDLKKGMVVEENGVKLKKPVTYRKYLKENIFSQMKENGGKNVIGQLSERNLLNEYHQGKESFNIQFKMLHQGKEIWVSCMIYLMRDDLEHHVQALIFINDIDEKKKKELELQERAEKDGLTGLYNAETVKIKVDTFLESLWAMEGKHIFALMDLDNFKEINDTFGHQCGDRVLKDVADTLRKKIRRDDIIGRLGGDEFVFMLLNVQEFSSVENIFKELGEELNKTYQKDGKAVTISASFGIAIAPEQGSIFQELYRKSDQVLYEVKRTRKNGYRLYDGQ